MRTSSVLLRELGKSSLRRFNSWVESGGKKLHRRMTEHTQVVSWVGFETGAKRTAKEGIITVKVRSTREKEG